MFFLGTMEVFPLLPFFGLGLHLLPAPQSFGVLFALTLVAVCLISC